MDDWRLTNQEEYLYSRILKKVRFSDISTDDHEHCSFCWAKFGKEEGMLDEGYCTTDNYHWICLKCFSDFKDLFKWKVE